MSEGSCNVEGCTFPMRHEHRRTHFDITAGILWAESYQQDQAMVNEARAVHGLPQLLYGEPEKPTQQLIWGPEEGIQAAGADERSKAVKDV